MKKIILFSVILFLTGLNVSLAQMVKVNPIPFYDYYMTEQYSAFQEKGTDETREKRDMNVAVIPSSDGITDIFATVTLVKKNGTQVLGPYTVYANETLTVELPKGKWGVIVNSGFDLFVSVWIGNNRSPAGN
jgi:hypothetical protein